MATFNELAYLVLDELRNTSDDSDFNRDHVRFLLSKYRSFLLKQRYADVKKTIPLSNYQTVCLNLDLHNMLDDNICGYGRYLRSVQKLPYTLSISSPKVSPIDFFGGEIAYVNWSRFRYVGDNKYLKSFIYSTIGPDNHLYLKSSNVEYLYLEKVSITALFEDIDQAAQMSCDTDGDNSCDPWEMTFPLEEALIPPMIQLVVQELTGALYRPKDIDNNGKDDLSGISVK